MNNILFISYIIFHTCLQLLTIAYKVNSLIQCFSTAFLSLSTSGNHFQQLSLNLFSAILNPHPHSISSNLFTSSLNCQNSFFVQSTTAIYNVNFLLTFLYNPFHLSCNNFRTILQTYNKQLLSLYAYFLGNFCRLLYNL